MEEKRNNQASAPGGDDSSEVLRAIALPKIILASASPRRAEILRSVNWPFETLPTDIDETREPGEVAVAYVQRLARAKAESAARRCPGATIVGADTVVLINQQILGKPRDQSDAREMLRQLSGEWHQVLTGIALVDPSASRVACQTTEVKFAVMSRDEIDWYVSSGEPEDKAGAYAIQGLGARFIEEIRGDYFNVVGLPVRLLYEMVQVPRLGDRTIHEITRNSRKTALVDKI
ncbi:MAG: nucleoside triphosphate pyrophosphatase [Blastocatellia bacterium]|jgi:septum formation protein|nr:nucleoside triphosphate pyrophosphatase [Blastocatellia bacterium]